MLYSVFALILIAVTVTMEEYTALKLWKLTLSTVMLGIGSAALIVGLNAAPTKKPTPAKNASSKEAKKVNVTFAKDVAPIIFNNCTTCHRPGEVAPFTLMNFAETKKRAKQIAVVSESRYMPPWKADPKSGSYHDERILTAEQIKTLKAWADAGAPEGKASETPKLPKFTQGWTFGTPDLVLEPGEEYTLGAEGRDVYRNFVIPTTYTEDKYVSAVEVRPGNRTVVHHVLIFLDTNGEGRKLDAKDAEPGYETFGGVGFTPSGSLGGWAPGNLPRFMPDGVGQKLPQGADVVLQVHYHKSGKAEKDRSKIGLYFSKKPIDKLMRVLPIAYLPLRIPANEANYRTQSASPVWDNITVHSVSPHMHLLGKEMTVTAEMQDGVKKSLVHVPDWDFNWQTTYVLKEPLKLQKGSKISMTARYDNTPSNPRNPSSPPKPVRWGEETTDEMCLAFVAYTVDDEHLTKGIVAEGAIDFGARGGKNSAKRGGMMQFVLKRFDANNNGKLDPDEMKKAMEAAKDFIGTSSTGKP